MAKSNKVVTLNKEFQVFNGQIEYLRPRTVYRIVKHSKGNMSATTSFLLISTDLLNKTNPSNFKIIPIQQPQHSRQVNMTVLFS